MAHNQKNLNSKNTISARLIFIPLSFLIVIFFSELLYSNHSAKLALREMNAHKIQSEIAIDGVLNEEVWNSMIQWNGEFTQRSPFDGKAASEKTEFLLLYDDRNIYFGIKCFDSEMDKIEKRMTRRDGFAGDWIELNIDCFNDNRTAFSFNVNAVGVKGDEIISQDGQIWDPNWDPIWYAKTSMDEKAWYVEIKIPLSQLRFPNNKEQNWGFQMQRRIFRKEEITVWQYIPQNTPGWVSNFGEISGINDIQPQKQIELTPYISGKHQTYAAERGNPFEDGSDESFYGGLDGKLGIGNSFTLNFTVNPDFGQVEADPSEVNLSGFETFFSEKRPFFVEGKNIFTLGITSGGSPLSSDNLFYSRRIGRQPQYYPDKEYIDMPENTRIISALKLSGKTKKGFSIGIMESITADEFAHTLDQDVKEKILVEPATNYFVASINKDFNQGNTIFSSMITSTNRQIRKDYLKNLHTNAYSAGFNLLHQWKDRNYAVRGNFAFSFVEGDSTAILETQTSQRHLFQRPDAKHFRVDSTARSLSGIGSTFSIGKQGGGHWQYNFLITHRSPGFELNDIGFSRRTDEIMQIFWAQYRYWEPKSFYRAYSINFNQWKGLNTAFKNLYNGGNVNVNLQLKNYWYVGGGINSEFNLQSPSTLRGGPMLRISDYIASWYSITTDTRKTAFFELSYNTSKAFDRSFRNNNYSISATLKPNQASSVSISPFIDFSKSSFQYITELSENLDKTYYIGAEIDRKTTGTEFRLNYSLTPEISIQYYGQPFVAAIDYTKFRMVDNPDAINIKQRFYTFKSNEIYENNENNIVELDVNNDGVNESIDQPDFNVIQFRSNLVARWEYLPGSALYLIWAQNRNDYPDTTQFNFNNDYSNVFDNMPHNIFLIKISYCIRV